MLYMFLTVTGHIQIAQVPDRHEPDSDGEISFSFLFKLLEELDYQAYIGCEYKPQGEWRVMSFKMLLLLLLMLQDETVPWIFKMKIKSLRSFLILYIINQKG